MDVDLYKKTLKEKGLTYEDLAKVTGLSLGCIKRIMAKIAIYPRIDTVQAIEHALGLDGNATRQSSALTDDEAELVALFREMDHAQKARFVAYGEGMLGRAANEKKIS